MNRLLFFLACAILFVNCNKETDVNPAEVKIVETNIVINGNTFYLSFEYDTRGRVVKLSRYINNETPETVATVTYTGNEALVEEKPVISASVNIISHIKFILDVNGKPLQRIAIKTEEFFTPNNPQRGFVNDTTIYTYSTRGILNGAIKKKRDSIWYQPSPGVINTNMQYTTAELSYVNSSNGNLAMILSAGTGFSRVYNGTSSVVSNFQTEESTNYEYIESYSNKTDFTNAFILEEFNALFSLPYPLNSVYKNLPNKISRQTVTRDAGGTPISASNESVNYIARFNSYGFLSNLNSAGGSGTGLNVKYTK